MKQISNRRAGFTLVEIMIVVAIIAILAAIAVPSFMRARKRSQAAATLELFRIVDGAKDQYAIETGCPGSLFVTPLDLAGYVKTGTQVYNDYSAGHDTTDPLGNRVYISTIDTPPQVATETLSALSDVIPDEVTYFGSYDNPSASKF